MSRHRRPDPLGDRVRHWARHRRTEATPRRGADTPSAPTPVGLGALALRLETLEAEVHDVRTRINALFFAVITAGIGELVGRAVIG